MATSNLPGPSACDDDPGGDEINTLLECYHSYVLALARGEIPGLFGFYDSDDLAQDVMIKLWRVLLDHAIESPGAYIRRAVHNEKVGLARKHRPYQYAARDEEGEIWQGEALVTTSEAFKNPEEAYIEQEAVRDRLNACIDALDTLHPRQKLAVTCAMQDCARDIPAIGETLRERDMDGEGWPEDPYERHLLQSSLSPARRNLKRLPAEQEK